LLIGAEITPESQEEQTFQAEVDKIGLVEKEAIIQATTSWEEKGIVKGKDEERRSMALKMLQENIPLETIARITEFSIAQLQQMQAEIQ
jgi:predicted transposase/invertase (TIGR01784 family)